MRSASSLLFFIFLNSILHAQVKKIDSLYAVANSQQHDTIVGAALNELLKIFINTGDSIDYFSAIEKYGKLYEKTKNLKIGGLYYLQQATFEERLHEDKIKALDYYQKSLECAIKLNDKVAAGKRLNRMGKLYMELGRFKEAIDVLYKALKYGEEGGNMIGVSYTYFGLGEVFRLQKNPKKALESYYRGYAIAQQTQDKTALSASYSNIGMIYANEQQTDSALYYFNAALEFNLKNNNEAEVASSLDRMATIYLGKGENQKAIGILRQSIKIKEKYGNKQELAVSYINLAEAYVGLKKNNEALKNLQTAIQFAGELNLFEYLEYCYKLQGVIYRLQGEHEKSGESLLKYIQLHDSLVNIQTSRLASEQEGKFQNEKKKKEIELLNKDKVIREANLKKQTQFTYFTVLAVVMLVVIVVMVVKGLKQKQRDNIALSEKNEIINKQKNLVEEKNKEITDSINYARRIQYALLASDNFLTKYLSAHFVYFNPKDIVSGDFYWAVHVPAKKTTAVSKGHNDLFFLAVCDSTGHGVPGAFMSLLNIGFLSEAINEKQILEPNRVFDHVRSRLIETISIEGQKDGFDGILICIDLKTKQISYAAANNAPVFISNGEISVGDTDKMPVGYGEKKNPFTLFTPEHSVGDMLYLYTDGYQDQFGGPKGKKFMSKKMNHLLRDTSVDGTTLQKTKIKSAFEIWKGDLEQVDDVCIIGIRT